MGIPTSDSPVFEENGSSTHYGASASSPAGVSESETGNEYLQALMGEETEGGGRRRRWVEEGELVAGVKGSESPKV